MNNPEKKKERGPGQGPEPRPSIVSDGSTASYYELPTWAREVADLIRYFELNGSQAEMFRALCRGARASHSDEKRQANKLLTYAIDEVVRTHFPEQSMADFRDQVFKVFFPDNPTVEHFPESNLPEVTCQTCAHCVQDQGTKCKNSEILDGESSILIAWLKCRGGHWHKAPSSVPRV